MYTKYKDSFPEVNDIEAKRALKLLSNENVIFVDVRDPEEQKVSMLPYSVTDKEFLKNPKNYKDRTIIAYCTVGYRSGKLAQKLKKKGIEMLNLAGGILAWLHAGGKVYKNGRPVKQVHVYSRRYDLPPSKYESIR